jgi:hypothetical protein
MDAGTIAFLFLIAFLCFIGAWYIGRRQKKAAEAMWAKYVDKIDAAQRMIVADPENVPVLDAFEHRYRPVAKECLYAVQPNVSKLEAKSTGKYVSSGASLSVPIAKGIRYRVGSGSVRSGQGYCRHFTR